MFHCVGVINYIPHDVISGVLYTPQKKNKNSGVFLCVYIAIFLGNLILGYYLSDLVSVCWGKFCSLVMYFSTLLAGILCNWNVL